MQRARRITEALKRLAMGRLYWQAATPILVTETRIMCMSPLMVVQLGRLVTVVVHGKVWQSVRMDPKWSPFVVASRPLVVFIGPPIPGQRGQL